MKYIIGIDAGNTAIKAVIFDEQGTVIAEHSTSNIIFEPAGKGFEDFDVNSAWESSKNSIKSAIEKSKVDPKDIVSIGVTSFGNGVVFIDEHGDPTCPGKSSLDYRAESIIDMYKEKGSWEKINNIINCKLFAGEPGPLLRWYKDNDPEVYKKTAYLLQLKDYIIYKLTGILSTDANIAGIAGLIDPTKREYKQELFDLYEIPDKWRGADMPYLAKTLSEIIGCVTPEASKETGLSESTKVGAGFMDILASVVGAGAIDKGIGATIGGTWCIDVSLSNTLIPDAHVNMPSIVQGQHVHCHYSGGGAVNYGWFTKTLAGNAKIEAQERGNISFFDVLDEHVRNVDPFKVEAFYHPFIAQPSAHREARANFFNINQHTSFGEIVYVVLEGMAFCHKLHMQFLMDNGTYDEPINKVRVTGGLARSKEWIEIYASVLGLPVEPVECEESGALGIALNAAIGAGLYKDYDDAVAKAVKTLPAVLPDLTKKELYATRYEEWYSLAKTMLAYWSKKSDGIHNELLF